MSENLPVIFIERLQKIIPAQLFPGVLATFSGQGPVTVRINTLKTSREQVLAELKAKGISFEMLSWSPDALILNSLVSEECRDLDLIKEDALYRQSLSSMLPVLVLDPQPEDMALDFCAAPGSKTTQMAALMQNQGEIVAVEAIRPRFYKLKAVCELLGAKNVSCKLTDARRFRSSELFDKVLVDAPCSSESRFKADDPKSVGYWSTRKIKEMVHKQRGLLLSASRFLKPGGTLVYSTCTFAPEENEGVVDWALRKSDGQLELSSAVVGGIKSYPAVQEWEGKAYSPGIEKVLRVLPDGIMEGFFIAKFIKR
ncbi:MAG: RsmB/NOP family class I SAM-dependent RNA methyltransferase [Candidatus Omnitrophica bacterium]|nr:RsmB/NOP family class I SAM-dependent RNA methyltransferase [Candidatus Omnitrophota bacterium]